MAEFRVVIDGELPAEFEHEIERSIQQAVLPHLSKVKWEIGDPIDTNGSISVLIPRGPHGPIPPGEIRGFVARAVAELPQSSRRGREPRHVR